MVTIGKTSQNRFSARKQVIGCLGPAFTFCAIAAEAWRGKSKTPIVYWDSIEEVICAVAQGKIEEGVIPIENRLQGTVRETMDALFNEEVFIVAEFKQPIHHNLAALPGVSSKNIQAIMSHSQALNQCRTYLKKNHPGVEWITASSTAAGFKTIHKHPDRSLAAIGTEAAAKHWGFKILARDIENDHDNFTRFIVVRRSPNKKPPKHAAKTSLIFYFSKNQPGSLFKVFKIFADLKINLSRIESRPAPKKLGEYLFYLDFEESASSTKGKQALEQVKARVDGLKLLGSY